MKKFYECIKFKTFIVLSILATITACNNNSTTSQSSANSINETFVEDSINKAKADSIKQIKEYQDSVRQDSIRNDSIIRNRITPDLALFELKGPVKSVNKGYIAFFTENGANFDKDGNLTSINKSYANDGYKLKRDSKNRIKSIICVEDPSWPHKSSDNIKYNDQNLPIECYTLLLESDGTDKYFYKNGVITSKTAIFSGEGDYGNGKSTITYTYLEYDHYGNWTKRKVHDKFKDDFGEGNYNKTSIQTRKIKYYK